MTIRKRISAADEILLVVPAGTFNHFAADLGVEAADDALAALRRGESVLVDLEPISPNWRWQWLRAQRPAQARA